MKDGKSIDSSDQPRTDNSSHQQKQFAFGGSQNQQSHQKLSNQNIEVMNRTQQSPVVAN